MGKFYLTTAIDYANGDPHIGHAYEKIGADAIARYRRMRGDDVYFLTGLDEHGQKVAQAAAERGVSPQQFVDEIAGRLRGDVAPALDLVRSLHAHDGRRPQARRARADQAHPRALARRLLREVVRRLVLRRLRAVQARRRDRRRQVRAAPDARAAVDDGAQLVLPAHALRAVPAAAVRRASGVPRAGDATQRDPRRCSSRGSRTSRSRGRGCRGRFPSRSSCRPARRRARGSGSTRCRTTSRRPASRTTRYHDRWPAQLHVIGKDITRLHTRRSGRRCCRPPSSPLPERVWAHGFVLLGGERFSKSAGVRLDLDEAIDRYGADALRYFLLREVAVRRRRQLLVRAVRRALHRRSRELTRQSGEPRDLDGREVLRRRRPERISRATSIAPTPPISPSITPRWMAAAATCCTKASSA